MFVRDIGLQFPLLVMSLSGFGVRVRLASENGRRRSLCFWVPEEAVEKWAHFFLKCSLEFTSETAWAWDFLFWKVVEEKQSIVLLLNLHGFAGVSGGHSLWVVTFRGVP